MLKFLHFQPLISGEAAASPASPVPTPPGNVCKILRFFSKIVGFFEKSGEILAKCWDFLKEVGKFLQNVGKFAWCLFSEYDYFFQAYISNYLINYLIPILSADYCAQADGLCYIMCPGSTLNHHKSDPNTKVKKISQTELHSYAIKGR